MSHSEEAAGGPNAWIRREWLLLGCLGSWLAVVAIAAIRAVVTDWYPIGDEALIAIRALDVFGPDHPLLGTAASVALGSGVLTNHPGPMLFDLVALPVNVFGVGPGLAIGVASVNLVAGAISIVFGRRQGGHRATVAVTLCCSALVWSGGNQLLIDAYNPTVSMLPFFAVLVLSWAVINRDLAAVPWLIVAGSFCAQTNLAYVIVTIPLMCIALGWLALGIFRERRHGGDDVPFRRPAILGLSVLVVCWAQPIIEQLLHGRDGNVARLARAARVTEPPLGVRNGTKRVASTLTVWPMWTRGSLDSYPLLDPGPSIAISVVSLLALIGVLLWLTWLMRRLAKPDDDRSLVRLAALAAIVVALGWLAAIRVPQSPFYGFLADYVRWLWPIGVFATMSGVLAIISLLGPRWRRWPSRYGLASSALLIVVAFVATVPNGPGMFRSREAASAVETANLLNARGIEALQGRPALFDPRAPDYPLFGFAFLAALRDHDQPFFVTDPIAVRQFGEGRIPSKDQALPTFYIPVGWEAVLHRDDAAAFASELAPEDLERLAELVPDFVDAFEAGTITLTDEGRTVADSIYGRPWMRTLIAEGRLPREEMFPNSETILVLLGNGMLDVPDELRPRLRQFVDLSENAHLRIASIMLV